MDGGNSQDENIHGKATGLLHASAKRLIVIIAGRIAYSMFVFEL